MYQSYGIYFGAINSLNPCISLENSRRMGDGRWGSEKSPFPSIHPSPFSPQTPKRELAKQTIDCLLFSSASKLIFFQFAASVKTRRDLNKDFTRMGSVCTTLSPKFYGIQLTGC